MKYHVVFVGTDSKPVQLKEGGLVVMQNYMQGFLKGLQIGGYTLTPKSTSRKAILTHNLRPGNVQVLCLSDQEWDGKVIS